MFCWQLVLSLCSCSNSSWSRRTGPWSKTVVVLITNITLQRGGIWNLWSKHHRKYFQTPQKWFIRNLIIWFSSVQLQPYNWVWFRISLLLSRESAIFRDEIGNYFLTLTWRDEIEIIIWPFSYFEKRTRLQIVILMFRDEIETSENHFSCWARKNQADSRREFPISRILVELFHTLHFLLRSSSAHSNSVLIFPNNKYRHTCYCLSNVK